MATPVLNLGVRTLPASLKPETGVLAEKLTLGDVLYWTSSLAVNGSAERSSAHPAVGSPPSL